MSASTTLLERGYVVVPATAVSAAGAWGAARAICESAARDDAIGAGMPPLEVVGEFVVPPPGAPQRDFQALHLDFGLPVAASAPADVARFTALHVDPARPAPTAATRIVHLRRLLGARRWDPVDRLVDRLAEHGRTGGGAVEGILGRLVEIADGSPTLPPPGDGLLCGMEFASLADEREHLAGRGLDLAAAEEHVRLRPGDLLVFDNLATAHGRAGARAPRELRQLCLGYRGLGAREQAVLLRRVLSAFSDGRPSRLTPRRPAWPPAAPPAARPAP
jgi:hypothetical protein